MHGTRRTAGSAISGNVSRPANVCVDRAVEQGSEYSRFYDRDRLSFRSWVKYDSRRSVLHGSVLLVSRGERRRLRRQFRRVLRYSDLDTRNTMPRLIYSNDFETTAASEWSDTATT